MLTVTRTTGSATLAVSVDIRMLPGLPTSHSGYTLVKSTSLPLVVVPEFTRYPLRGRTPAVRDAIVAAVPGVDNAADVTEAHLAAITALYLSSQDISALKSGDFDGLTNLTILNLSENKLSTLPEGIFDELTSLTWLYLDSNNLTTLSTDIFSKLTTLTELRLNNNTLTTLPENIFSSLTALKQLWLGFNSLTTLPENIFSSLTALTELDLSNNAFTSLPEDIFDGLTALGYLALHNATLTSLPNGIFDQLTLTDIILSNNALTSLPAGIFDGLTGLRLLWLQGNAVDPLPLTISLEKVGDEHFKAVAPTGAPFDIVLPLTVTNGSVTGSATNITLPKGSVESEPLAVIYPAGSTAAATVDIGTLPGIASDHNGYVLVKSTDLPLTFLRGSGIPVSERSPKVRDAIVAAIEDVDSADDVTPEHLATITELDLTFGRNPRLKNGDFDGLWSLTTLDLSNILDLSLPRNIFSGLPSLTTLKLNNLGFSFHFDTGVFDPLTNLTTLSMYNTHITLSPGIFDKLTNLTSLVINSNRLRSLPEGVFDNLTNLKSLQLYGCINLLSLPSNIFDKNTALTDLNLWKNPLTSLPSGIFDELTALESLNLSDCDLSSLPSGIFDELSSLIKLYLSGNDIIDVSELEELISLTSLTLSGNPISNYSPLRRLITAIKTIEDHPGLTLDITIPDVDETLQVPVSDRTPEVRDAIVAAVPNVSNAAHVTKAHLAAITSLNLRNAGITTLQADDFSGMTGLTSLNLFNNQLSSLPDGIFEGLTSLTTIRLGRNVVDPLPFIVSLVKVADGQFKAVAPAGALFNIVLPITVTNGSITGGATTITIPQGSVESGILTLTRNVGTTVDVTVDIGTLPSLPPNHFGYVLVRSDSLPLTVISGTNSAPVFTDGTKTIRTIAENTASNTNIGTPISATDADNDTLAYTLGGTDAASFEINRTTGQLKTKAALDYETKTSYSVTVSVSDGHGGTDSITVTINVTDVTEPSTPQQPTTPVESEYDHIEGPWLWMIAPGGDLNSDNLSEASEGMITETQIAENGVNEGDHFNQLQWTSGRILPTTVCGIFLCSSDNVINVVRKIGLTDKIQLAYYSAYALINIHSPRDQDNVLMGVGSDDSIKVWLNGSVVYKNDVSRRTTGIQNRFRVNLNAGNNLLLIKVCNSSGWVGNDDWGMFFKIYLDTQDYSISLPMRDTDNSAPVFTEGSSTTRSIAENTAAGQHIGTAVGATDSDGNTLAYTLGGTDAASFGIDRTTGQLKTKAALDYETKTSYTVTVTVFDGTLTDTITVTINVTDVAETTEPNPPTIPTLTVATTAPLTEAMLHGEVITLNLTDGTFDNSGFRIRNAVSVSGIPGITVARFGGERISDTQATVELAFDGNMTADGTLTVSVGAGAIQDYDGDALTSQISVTPVTESITASTASALTEATLDEAVVTITLSGRKFERSVFDIRGAVSVSGITGVAFPWHEPDRDSDTKITIKLDFDGDITTDATLTFTVGADAIAGYNGHDLTAQVSVSASVDAPAETGDQTPETPETPQQPVNTDGTPTLTVTTATQLTEATLNDTVVSLNLSGGTFDSSHFRIRNGVSVSGIPGVTVARFGGERISDTQATVELAFDGNMTSNGTLTVSVGSGALKDYDGAALTSQISVTAVTESITVSPASLTAATLDEAVVTITLSGRKFERSAFDIRGAVSVSGITGVAFPSHDPDRKSDTEITIKLDFDGDITADATLTFTVGGDAIAGYNGDDLTAQITVTINITDVTEGTIDPPLSERTQRVRDTIVWAVPGVNSADDVTAAHLAAITSLSINGGETGALLRTIKTGDLSGLDSLTSFKLYWNQISSLPSDLFKDLTNLTSINLQQCHGLSTLPEDLLDGLSSLTTFTLYNCVSITSLPEDLFDGLSSLTTIYLTANDRLLSVPEGLFEGLSSVTTIRLTGQLGGLTSVPEGLFEGLSSLSNIDLSGHDLTSLPSDLFEGLSSLSNITLRRNQLTSLPSDLFEGLSALSSISVSGNPLTDYATLKTLKQNNSDISIDIDLNNNLPVFNNGESTTRSLPENPPRGTNAGSPISAADADEDTLVYTLSGTDSSLFNINRSTGQLTTDNTSSHFPTNATFSVTVMAYDGNSGADLIDVTITVGDEGTNNPPVFTDGSSTTRSVAENTVSGQNIGSAVSATDRDSGDTLTYTLGGTDAASFRIVSTSGQLQTHAALDYETKNSYSVTVSVSDGNGGSDSITVTINVTDVDETDLSDAITFAYKDSSATRIGNTNIFRVTVTGTITASQSVRVVGTVEGYVNDDSIGIASVNESINAGESTDVSVSGIWEQDGSTNQTVSIELDVTTITGLAPAAQPMPSETVLMSNFPNPFNPETWIPYQLAKPSEVTLTIYDMRGVVVRELKLGHQAAGVYSSRSRAIHWDGRNSIGEKVATGVYFYTLKAGDFTATRKMLIRK